MSATSDQAISNVANAIEQDCMSLTLSLQEEPDLQFSYCTPSMKVTCMPMVLTISSTTHP